MTARDEIVSADMERAIIEQALTNRGATALEAQIVGDVLLEADLRDIQSHGIRRLPTIVARIDAGIMRLGVEPTTIRSKGAVEILDGHQALGPVVALWAMRRAISAAHDNGVAVIGIRNNNHIGMAGWYAEAAAEAGCIGLVMTTTEAYVHPHGGRDRMLGTNPIAIAVPTSGQPFVLDMSTSTTAIGRLLSKRDAGESIPNDWAVDELGNETTDPERALHGSINPIGGAKGYGLGLAISLMVASLTESALGSGVVGTLDAVNPATKGDVVIAIDGSLLGIRDQMEKYLDRIRESNPIPGVERVLVPGDRARSTRRERLASGIPLPAPIWAAALRTVTPRSEAQP